MCRAYVPPPTALIADQLRSNLEFCAEWERTVLARAVAVAIVRSGTAFRF
jgi:hypothetical protein